MNLPPFTGPGSTPARRQFWEAARAAVLSAQKVAGRNVTVDEHPGKGTLINVKRERATPTTPPAGTGACCYDDGTCEVLAEADCTETGGNYQGDDTVCDPNPCAQPTTCCDEGGNTIIPLVNMNYEASVSGSWVSEDNCPEITYTLSGSSGSRDHALGNSCSFSNYQDSVLNDLWEFDTSPPGNFSPNCFAQFSIFLHCQEGSGWTLEVVVSSSDSSGNCSGLCAGSIIMNWGGGDSGEVNVNPDPRGTYSIDIPDTLLSINWHFDITIT